MFEIFRLQKLKSVSDLKGSLMHALREQNTPNADPSRLHQNEHLTKEKTVIDCLNKYKSKLPEKVRKDAVYAVEYLITAGDGFADTPESIQNEFLRAGHKWIADQYGEENIIYSGIHRDESTPHLSVMVIPLKDGRLNAKHFIGGSKHRLSEMQDDFHDKVGAQFGLQRGVKGSKAEHVPLRQYYKHFNEFQDLNQSASIDDLASKALIDVNELAPRIEKKSFLGKDIYESAENVITRIEDQAQLTNLSVKNLFKKAKDAIEQKKEAEERIHTLNNKIIDARIEYIADLNNEINKLLPERMEQARNADKKEISRLRSGWGDTANKYNHLLDLFRKEQRKNKELTEENKVISNELEQHKEILNLINGCFKPGEIQARIKAQRQFEIDERQRAREEAQRVKEEQAKQAEHKARLDRERLKREEREKEMQAELKQASAERREIEKNKEIAPRPTPKRDDYSFEP